MEKKCKPLNSGPSTESRAKLGNATINILASLQCIDVLQTIKTCKSDSPNDPR